MTYYTSVALYWMKQLFLIRTNSAKLDAPYLIRFFPLYPGLKLFQNLLLSAGLCWESRNFFREIDQMFISGGTISYGDSYLKFLLRPFKLLRVYAILHDAAAAARAHSNKVPG